MKVMACECSLSLGWEPTDAGGAEMGGKWSWRCPKPWKQIGKQKSFKTSFILMCLCFRAENLPVIPSIVVVVYIRCAWYWFMAILGLATVLVCRKPKCLRSRCVAFKQTQILLPSAPFHRMKYELSSESSSTIATGIDFQGFSYFSSC